MFTISADGTAVEEVGTAVKLNQSSAGTTINQTQKRAYGASYDKLDTATMPTVPKVALDVAAELAACVTSKSAERFTEVSSGTQSEGVELKKRGIVKAIVANFICVVLYGPSYNGFSVSAREKCLAAVLDQHETEHSVGAYACIKFAYSDDHHRHMSLNMSMNHQVKRQRTSLRNF